METETKEDKQKSTDRELSIFTKWIDDVTNLNCEFFNAMKRLLTLYEQTTNRLYIAVFILMLWCMAITIYLVATAYGN